MNIIDGIRSFFSSSKPMPRPEATRLFKKRYASFKELLHSNAELGKIMAGMEDNLRGDKVFGVSYIHSAATKAIFHTMRMVSCLNQVSNDKYLELNTVVANIQAQIKEEVDTCALPHVDDLTLPFSAISPANAYSVGSKTARLAEMHNSLQLPVPRGFGVTTAAYQQFMRQQGLLDAVRKIMHTADYTQPETISAASKEVIQRINDAPVPQAIVDALDAAWDKAYGDTPDARAALRSSAFSEDGGISSFAGQYLSVLGVRREGLADAFRRVTASFFSPEAITYRLRQGHSFERCSMSMCCVEMVDAAAAGVLFSRHPVDLASDCVVINGVWGLGELVVNDSSPTDIWLVQRDSHHIVERRIANKPAALRANSSGGTELVPLPQDKGSQPCLTDGQLRDLTRMSMALEQHFMQPQDVEWAVDQRGQLVFLQTRPMRLAAQSAAHERPPALADATLLLDGGDIVCSGVGSGPVVIMDAESDFSTFPEGGVMVMRHSAPNCVAGLERAQALITEMGSITGHTASICREFNVPALFNLPDATTTLAPNTVVTVDAISARVYAGAVPELLQHRTERAIFLKDTPVHNFLRRVSEHIIPLHLTDPKAENFAPEACTTLHDTMRFVHERCYEEMFRFSDSASNSWDVAVRFKASVPFDLYLIDMGGGLKDLPTPWAGPDDVSSIPFAALLKGMLDPAVAPKGPRPVDLGGFMSVLGKNLVEPPDANGQRFGDKSYAIISDHYLNFSSRVGYHYGILDCWCGYAMNSNYINFKFAGGAANEVRRERRVRCLGIILGTLGFTVEITGDSMNARFAKYDKDATQARLIDLGRLLLVSRQMDMLMVDENSVTLFAERFLRGEYH